MDGRGRIAQSLNLVARLRSRPPDDAVARASNTELRMPPSRTFLQRFWLRFIRLRVPRGVGIVASAAVIFAGIAYGAVKGDHIPAIVDAFKDARDQVANAVGFRIVELAVNGHQHMSREEVLAVAGITGRSSLAFLDVDGTRDRLKASPWIGDATVRKLLPNRLEIDITEREPFALWQKNGRVSVIAHDGTVLEAYAVPQLFTLPLVVGPGAETRARDFLALLDRYPAIRAQVRASVFVGERRWNLRLRNGLDVKLPEANVARALERLVVLERDKRLLSRDIVMVDMRLADRVTVRLSERAAQAWQEQQKDTKKAKKGGRA
jgi:cell division protein FtsQ